MIMNVFAATILAAIKRSRKGVATLKNKTGFEDRKISGIVQRFKVFSKNHGLS